MSGRFAYEKNWGAELLEGGARFRLWAPSQDKVSLVVSESGSELPMRKDGDGWYEIETDAVAVGRPYEFRLADGMRVPDPAARAQAGDIHGPSRLVDPRAYAWKTADWKGRPWEETVFYETHIGTFTEAGTFESAIRRLDELADLGITTVELLPVAQFGGTRNWGYDGALLYAPHTVYGGPEGLKALVDAIHERGLMAFLDVVYNHFGPDGNYLSVYAADFFHPERQTPWGSAIAFEQPAVKAYFLDNILYWLEEFRFDGLRFDAVDQLDYQTEEPVLQQMAEIVRQRITDREIHLTTEDDRNIVSLHQRDARGRPTHFSGEWNDDYHHVVHVLLTGEDDHYYEDYQDRPVAQLARALAAGYIYQGEASPFRDGETRGEPSGGLPPTAFVNFLQNHDQTGNRALGQRLATLAPPEAVQATLALLLLAPQIPLLWMGEEHGEDAPYLFFTEFEGELGEAVRKGRAQEFAKMAAFRDSAIEVPNPNDLETFAKSKLRRRDPERFVFVKGLLAIRRERIVPLLKDAKGDCGTSEVLSDRALKAEWTFGKKRLSVVANLGPDLVTVPDDGAGDVLFRFPDAIDGGAGSLDLPGWSVLWRLDSKRS